jgi:hypothetical protein
MFPHSYPSEEDPICLSMTWEGKDDHPEYWVTECQNLDKGFDRWIRPRIAERDHFWCIQGPSATVGETHGRGCASSSSSEADH